MKTTIRSERNKLGLTQSDLALKAGVSRTVIAQLEAGSRTVVTSRTMQKIAEALESKVEDIFLLN